MLQITKRKQKTPRTKAPRAKAKTKAPQIKVKAKTLQMEAKTKAKAKALYINKKNKIDIKRIHLLAQQLCIEKKQFTSTIINGISVHKTLYDRYYMLVDNTINGPFTTDEYYNHTQTLSLIWEYKEECKWYPMAETFSQELSKTLSKGLFSEKVLFDLKSNSSYAYAFTFNEHEQYQINLQTDTKRKIRCHCRNSLKNVYNSIDVYRGVSTYQKLIQLKKGDHYQFQQFTSTTSKIENTKTFLKGSDTTLIKISGVNPTCAAQIKECSVFPTEEEW